MARKPRYISPEGYLRCTRCGEDKHLSAFYQTGNRFIRVGEDWYGKPQSWCITCIKVHNKTRTAEWQQPDPYVPEPIGPPRPRSQADWVSSEALDRLTQKD